MEKSEHSTSPRSSFVAPHREITLVKGIPYLFIKIDLFTNRSKCSLFLSIHPIVESESSLILPIPLLWKGVDPHQSEGYIDRLLPGVDQ